MELSNTDINELKEFIKKTVLEILETKEKERVYDDVMPFMYAYDHLLKDFFAKSYVYELINKNKIPFIKKGRYVHFSMTELEKWLIKEGYNKI